MSPHPPPPPSANNASPNLSVALARQSACRRTDRRRRQLKHSTSDPLQFLALVVSSTTRKNVAKLVCRLCASTFGRRCELKRHVSEVHTFEGKRRFACKHVSCGKSFTRKDALAKHEIVKHQGKRRFVCPKCSEKFTSRYDLSRHTIRVHSNVKKRFTCEFCAAGFSQKSQLTMHKGRVHSQSDTSSCTTTSSEERMPLAPKHARLSIDSLAAVAVAMAKEEENKALFERQHIPNLLQTHLTTPHTYGPPSHYHREASQPFGQLAKISTPKEEAAAATLVADTILEAAAALQPSS